MSDCNSGCVKFEFNNISMYSNRRKTIPSRDYLSAYIAKYIALYAIDIYTNVIYFTISITVK